MILGLAGATLILAAIAEAASPGAPGLTLLPGGTGLLGVNPETDPQWVANRAAALHCAQEALVYGTGSVRGRPALRQAS